MPLLAGLAEAKSRTGKGKPVCVLLHTEMGNGVDFMMHTHAWHGKAPNDEQLESALEHRIQRHFGRLLSIKEKI